MLKNIMSIGTSGMLNSQAALSVVSNNIANVSTPGYTRRTVEMDATDSIYRSGFYFGTGVEVEEVQRQMNQFIEGQYLNALSSHSMWESGTESLYAVESLFLEENDYGLASAMAQFWDSLSGLAEYPDELAARSELSTYAGTLASLFNTLSDTLDSERLALEDSIETEVEQANALISDIAALNKEIQTHGSDNTLLDERDQKIRELAEIVDVRVINQEDGTATVLTNEGQTLADGPDRYFLSLEGPQSRAILSETSSFDGAVYFQGTHNGEILVECTGSGPADGSASAATFRVSLDGGATWVSDASGSPMEYLAGDITSKVSVEGVDIWFGQADDASATATTSLQADDGFTLIPKSGLYWHRTTSGLENISPLEGAENRLSGGSLAGLLSARDSLIGYGVELDALAGELIWQTNRAHSQGGGLNTLSTASSGLAVHDASLPLSRTDIPFAQSITQGNLSFALYDESTGESLGVEALDFSGVTPGLADFDPAVHSLEDVAQAVNDTFPGQLSASITGGVLSLAAADGYTFQFAGDSTGLLAATETNTFFTGDDAGTMAVSSRILAEPSALCAGAVDATGHVASGDNSIAAMMLELRDRELVLSLTASNSSQTLDEHLASLAAHVGQDVDGSARNATFAEVLLNDLTEQREAVSGVNLDEELTMLTRYQQSYQAAAQVIQTATEMFDVLLTLK